LHGFKMGEARRTVSACLIYLRQLYVYIHFGMLNGVFTARLVFGRIT